MGLTSTTAPGKVFVDRVALANHYKSDWHKYNLKRREAGMPLLAEEDFQARLEAALALRREREGREARTGKDHLKKDKKKKKSNNNNNNNNQTNKTTPQLPSEEEEEQQTSTIMETDGTTAVVEEKQQEDDSNHNNKMEVEEGPPVIDPRQCLFDNTVCVTVQDNIDRMYQKYGFFIPDQEYLISPENLVGYCAEKIKLGQICLYCQKSFSSWKGCQEHMIMTRHTKIRYERGIDQEEFDVFYDFTEADAEFLGTTTDELRSRKQMNNDMDIQEDENVDDNDDDDSGEWEDVDEEDDDDDDMYGAYKDEISKHGFDITPLGELVFPDGRIIGHRGLSRYYKQRFAPTNQSSAVVAARRAAGERLYEGQVYDTYQEQPEQQTALQLAKAGIAPGAAKGRQGRGILVSNSSSSYTTLSLYRYKAAMKKSRRDEFRGRRLQQRTTLPMNKMDKKANRLMNGVSVAHAAR